MKIEVKKETTEKLVIGGLYAWAIGSGISAVALANFLLSKEDSGEALIRAIPRWAFGSGIGILGLSVIGIAATAAVKSGK